MAPRTRITSLLVLTGVLTLAAISPQTTYKIISKPSRALAKYQWEKTQRTSLDRWSKLLTEAEQGDVKAMSLVGRRMLGPRSESWTGIEKDSLRGEEFVRAAATLNDADALIETWKLDGSDPSALPDLSAQVLKAEPEFWMLLRLSGALSWNIMERCDPTLRDELGQVKKAIANLDSTRAQMLWENLAEFDETFANYCNPNAPLPITPEL